MSIDKAVIEKLDREFRKSVAGKPFRPANGSEGDYFMEDFCFRCKHWVYDKPTETYGCKKRIHDETLFHDVDDPEYPKQWKYDDEGYPLCTAFVDENTPVKKRKPKQKPIPLFEDN